MLRNLETMTVSSVLKVCKVLSVGGAFALQYLSFLLPKLGIAPPEIMQAVLTLMPSFAKVGLEVPVGTNQQDLSAETALEPFSHVAPRFNRTRTDSMGEFSCVVVDLHTIC